jgi:hypothetical protein
VEQLERIELRPVGDSLGHVSKADQQEQDEGDGSEQRVEGQGTGEKRNVVFVGRLQRAADEPGG